MKRYPNPKLMMFVLALALSLLAVAFGRLPQVGAAVAPNPTCTMNPVVTNNGNSGTGTLQQAVLDACAGSTITFANNVTGTIFLPGGQITIDKNLTIQGPGANLLTVQNTAAQSVTSRVFLVNAGVTATISGLTISGGSVTDTGNGILNNGTLTVTNSTISNNSANSGGGIYNSNLDSILNVANSTIQNNAAQKGGGIYNFLGTVNITNSTINNNDVDLAGGGIYSTGVLTFGVINITNSTISTNTVGNFGGSGGGIYNVSSSTVNCRNTIIAGNNGPIRDFFGTLTSQGDNLIGVISGTTIVGDTTGNLLNQNAMLGPLQDNGGPTKTMALLPGSPAIDQGRAANNPVTMNPIITDQRNYTRPFDNPAIANITGGDGSDIGAYEANSSPTAVKLGAVNVTAQDGGVFIEWDTGFEVNNLGFNLYREVDGQRTRITAQLIAGSALTDGPGTSLLAGHRYFWADSPPKGKTIRYWLEDLDLDGTSTLSGPYYVSYAQPSSAAAAQRRSALISQIGIGQAQMANGLGSAPLARAARLATPTAVTLQLQSDLDAKPAVKIAVKQEGFFLVTQSELLRAGLDPKSDPRRLQLFVDGVEQPIRVTGEQDGSFDADDAVEFYGIGLDTPSTDTRVYWLVEGRSRTARGFGFATDETGDCVAESAVEVATTGQRR